jgi:uncharacterized protein (DUF1501 family)
MKNAIHLGRREFLRRMGISVGALGMWSMQDNLRLMGNAMAATVGGDLTTGYRSLVCVFLYGGSDSWNMTVPTGLTAYNKYAAVRQNQSLARASLLPAKGGAAGFGFHPSMAGLRNLYDENRLAVVANTGNLFEPVTSAQVFTQMEGGNPGVVIPPELFTHSHQTETWQTALPSVPGVANEGWGGRMADLIAESGGSVFPPSFTLTGNNAWQGAQNAQAYGLRPLFDENGQLIIDDFRHFNGASWPVWAPSRAQAWQQILALASGHPLESQAKSSLANTKQSADLLRSTLGSSTITTPYNSNNPLAVQLRAAARLIAARQNLGLHRQIIFVSLGGWDTHSNHLQDHGNLAGLLSEALESFYRTTVELGIENSVTTFTATEFGRTFTSNGDGVDHAWATDLMVMGGAVKGGQIHGEPIQYSDVPVGVHWGENLFGANDVGSGRFIPKYSTDQYGATLAKWMGFSDIDLLGIFPNLNNFTQKNLGFMI